MRMPEPRATSAKITSPIRRLPRDGGTASVVSVVFMGCLRFEKGVRDVFVETMVVTRAHRMGRAAPHVKVSVGSDQLHLRRCMPGARGIEHSSLETGH